MAAPHNLSSDSHGRCSGILARRPATDRSIMLSNRRDFLQTGLAGLWTLSGRSPASARGLDPAVIGANPYFPGYDLYRSIRIMRDIGFQTIEMHPMGSPEAIAGMPPGFQYDRIDDDEKRKIKEALSGFRYISTHLPWTDTPYFSPFVPTLDSYGSLRHFGGATGASARAAFRAGCGLCATGSRPPGSEPRRALRDRLAGTPTPFPSRSFPDPRGRARRRRAATAAPAALPAPPRDSRRSAPCAPRPTGFFHRAWRCA